MKPFILIFLFTFVTYSIQEPPKTQEEIDAAIKECTESTNVDPKFLRKLYTTGEFTDDKNLKCYIKCMAVKMGGMTESGELLVDDVREKFADSGLSDEKTNEIIEACKNTSGTDPCDTAYSIAKCMMEQTIKGSGK